MISTLKKLSARAGANNHWQLQAAKARFSELFRIVRSKGPQWVTKQGKEAVVVLSAEQFEKLQKQKAGYKNLAKFFAKSPLVGSGISLERDKDYGRKVSL